MRNSPSAAVRAVAREHPQRPAVVTRESTWSYAQLDAEVERVASWLYMRTASGDAPSVVALRFRGAVPLIVSGLAAARAGLVITLIDPVAPAARVRLVLDDLVTTAGRPLLITDCTDEVAESSEFVLFSDIPSDAANTSVPHSAQIAPDELHQIIYTSGSTGVPVGLCVTGRGYEESHDSIEALVDFGESARRGMIFSGSVGMGMRSPLLVLQAGATLVVHDVLTDGLSTIPQWLREQRVEGVGLVPTLSRFLVPLLDEQLGSDGVLPDLASVAFWGEGSDWADFTGLCRHLTPHATLHNIYGTTEAGAIASLSTTAAEIAEAGERTGPVPAGVLARGVTVRILDPAAREVAAGEHGEITVSGPNITDGFWRRPDLTARVFSTSGDGRVECRTGDDGWLDDDGTLHVSGRLDHVVKIAGHRVDLAELEQAAREQHAVASAAATARVDPQGTNRLHLYVVPRPGAVISTRWVRAAMARSLPPSMLPDTIDVLAELPTLGSGKIDRTSLPAPSRRPAPEIVTHDPMTSTLAELFAELLDGPVGPDDDFFELGGDSLRAGRLVAALQTRLGHVVPSSLLLEASTPAALAAALDGRADAMLVPVRTTGERAPLFLVHGGTGSVWWARSVAAHLDDTHPVYGLQPPPLTGPSAFVPTLREVAQRYVAEVRRVWPDGPYRLYGESVGGLIAFEMAIQLQERGADVELLALGDSVTPELMLTQVREQRTRTAPRRSARPLARRIVGHGGYRLRQLRRTLSGQRGAQSLWASFIAGAAPDPEIRGAANMYVYGQLALAHRIEGRFRGELTVVVAGRQPGPPDRGWTEHVDGSVRPIVVDAEHGQLVDEPTVAELARVLARTTVNARSTPR